MDFKSASVAADILRTFGFVVMRQFFDADPLAGEIVRAMRDGFASQRVTDYGGINFQYVPMMTAETPVSLSLLDRAGALAEALLGGPVLPTRAKAVRYIGNSPWHTDSESPVTSIGFIAYCESLHAENGALRVLPGSHYREYGGAIRKLGLTAEGMLTAVPAHVIETEPGDLILIDEHLFHSSCGGAVRRQWRVDYLRVPGNADEERNTKAYFTSIYPPDWDGGYDVDRYPSYGPDWRSSGRPSTAQLERLGVYDLAARQEAFTRSRKRSELDL
jgi:phytanoyl-CoA dioxygenase PhyH